MKMNLKASFLSVCLFLLVSVFSIAQPGRQMERPENAERIESARIAFITNKLNLSKEQAQKFWPVYNEYDEKRKELRGKSRVFKEDNLATMSDSEVKDGMNAMFDFRQKELNLEKEYVEKFQKVISIRQVAMLYKAEKDFTRMLLHRMEERREGRDFREERKRE